MSLSVQDGQPTEPLALSANDVNALIATNRSLTSLKGQIFVSMNGNEFRAQISDVDLPQRFWLRNAVQREPPQASEGDAFGEALGERIARRG